jgi:ribosomal-protein-alanine N-acetyltransferase
MTLSIGLMSFSLLPQVLDIEQRAYRWPWTEGMFVDSLRSGHLCYVVRRDDTIVGHLIAYVAVGECHILNICIDPDAQGNGFGRMLLEYGLRAGIDLGAENAFLEVRVSNQAAIVLYERIGFQQVGLRKQYYPDGDGREDALVYLLELEKLQR